jgi:hypothetical protein
MSFRPPLCPPGVDGAVWAEVVAFAHEQCGKANREIAIPGNRKIAEEWLAAGRSDDPPTFVIALEWPDGEGC